MNQCKVQYKRERIKESGSIANTRIYFEIRAHSSTSPPSHRRIFTISSTQDFPHREPPLRILGNYNLGVHNSSLQHLQPLHLEARHKANTKINLTNEGQAQSHSNTINSHLRDSNTNSTSHQREPNSTSTITSHLRDNNSITSHQRDITMNGRFTTWWSNNHKQLLFPQNKDPNRQDSR